MLSVSVHKDIAAYTEKVVGKLSARTLACTAGGIASAVAVAAVANLALGVPVDTATLPVMTASMPFWLLGFWRPKGLPAEKFAPLFVEHTFGNRRLLYATGCRPSSIAGGIKCEKTDRRARRTATRKGAERSVKEL